MADNADGSERRPAYLLHAGFLAAVLLLIGLGFMAYISITAYLNSSEMINGSNILQIQLDHFASSLKDIQRGARGYVITGDPTFLSPYQSGTNLLARETRELRTATANSASLTQKLETMVGLSDRIVRVTHDEVGLVQKGDFDAARGLVRDGEAKAAMDGVESIVQQMTDEESRLVEARKAGAASSLKDTLLLLGGGGGLSLILLIIIFVALSRQSRKRRELAEHLRQGEERLQAVVNSINEGITFSTAQGGFEVYSRRMRELTGYTVEEANRSGDFSRLLYPDPVEHQKVLDGVKFIMLTPGPHTSETTITTKSRVRRTLRVTSQMLTYQQRKMFLTTYEDVTERKRAEDAALRAEEKYRSIVENAAEGIYQSSVDGSILTANPAMARIFGFKSVQDFFDAAALKTTQFYVDPDRRLDFIRGATQNGSVRDFESRAYRKDGRVIQISENARALYAPDGELAGFEGTVVDITARKDAEERIMLDSEIMKGMCEGVSLIRASDGCIVHTNPRFEQMFGYAEGELINRSVSILNAPTDRPPEETAGEILAELRKAGMWKGDILNIRKDGTTFWCSATVSTFDHAEYGQVWISIHTDISDRKRAESERESVITELQRALADVKTLSGLVPICSNCKKIRDDKGFWNQIEAYIQHRTGAQFTHGICPDCAEKLYPGVSAAQRATRQRS